MKPVTELYEAAESAYRGAGDRRLGEAVLKFDIDMGDEHEPNRDMLEVLDLVATLPPERLGLVRWVAGLGEEEQALLGQALANQQELVDEWAPEEAEDARRFVAMREGFVAAVSGGEGGAKEEPPACTSNGCRSCGYNGGCDQEDAPKSEDEIRALEARLSEVRAKISNYDGRDWTASQHVALLRQEAELSMRLHSLKSERDQAQSRPTILPAEEEKHELRPRLAEVMRQIDEYEGDDREHRAPQALLREADELAARLEAATPKPTILPAGKPPPFLRVGMVLAHGGLELELIEHGAEYRVPSWRCWSGLRGDKKGRRLAWWPTSWLEKMPLAEPFTVEGEAAPAERRKPCTCNSSPSPRRCVGQARLGGGWYCVEGKP